MSKDLTPLLALLSPVLEGLDIGLQQGAGNVKAAVQNTGVALDQTANGVADIAGNTVAGAGQTVGEAPAGVLRTVHAIDTSPGVVGSVAKTVFGSSK